MHWGRGRGGGGGLGPIGWRSEQVELDGGGEGVVYVTVNQSLHDFRIVHTLRKVTHIYATHV